MVVFFRDGFNAVSSLVQRACRLPEYLYINMEGTGDERKKVLGFFFQEQY